MFLESAHPEAMASKTFYLWLAVEQHPQLGAMRRHWHATTSTSRLTISVLWGAMCEALSARTEKP
jgi:hypothetical protein